MLTDQQVREFTAKNRKHVEDVYYKQIKIFTETEKFDQINHLKSFGSAKQYADIMLPQINSYILAFQQMNWWPWWESSYDEGYRSAVMAYYQLQINMQIVPTLYLEYAVYYTTGKDLDYRKDDIRKTVIKNIHDAVKTKYNVDLKPLNEEKYDQIRFECERDYRRVFQQNTPTK